MHNFRELKVWQKARVNVKLIYELTSKFPKEEVFGITSQMRRAAISISSNIAEGSGRTSNKDFKRFLEIAVSSACELETQLLLSNDLGFLSETDCIKTIENVLEIKKMLNGLMASFPN